MSTLPWIAGFILLSLLLLELAAENRELRRRLGRTKRTNRELERQVYIESGYKEEN